MKLKDNWIVKNLVLALLYFAFLVLGVSLGLHLVTRHGKTVTAPDFTNLSVSEARQLAQASHVNVKVVDSVYVRRLSGGVVYRQLPKAGAISKYLTLVLQGAMEKQFICSVMPQLAIKSTHLSKIS